MSLLTLFAFIAGVITILSPCILPILPIILASSGIDARSKKRPYGIVVGFVASFTFFTLFLSSLVKLLNIPADTLRAFSIVVIALFGTTLIVPSFQKWMESLFLRLANYLPSSKDRTGFGGGVMIGLSIGLLWTPCVGPILASVITLAISGTVTGQALLITLAYAMGTVIPMYGIIRGGQELLTRIPWLVKNTGKIQYAFGVVMILTAFGIYAGADRKFQTYILTKFPNYGTGLTQFEEKVFDEEMVVETKKDNSYEMAPELIVGGKWFNSQPLSMAELRGKVVLVDFWTYTCINCQRTFPYLKSWHDKYSGKGLVIIGVHAPEFEFEKNPDNVAEALVDFDLQYPVMQDNEFATWKAYHNRYWPAKYLIDQDGKIRYTHFGEGDYDETEEMIQQLLEEAGNRVKEDINNPTYKSYGRTPETYLGSERSRNERYISYEGEWMQSKEYASPSAGSRLRLEFEAKLVHLVMRGGGETAMVKIYLDGEYREIVAVKKDALYTLIELTSPGKHELELEFLDDNAELFAFTFG